MSDRWCLNCDFLFIIKLSDGSYIECAAGQLKALDENNKYDASVNNMPYGLLTEKMGGAIGKLLLCLVSNHPELVGKEVDILIEGRWKRIVIR
jgi:hypothetical protein